MRGLVDAARYLTVVPLPGPPTDPAALGRAVPWFPVVGLALGAVVAATAALAAALFPGPLAALLAVTVWKLATGGLHLDGLADCLDGLGGADATQRLRVMRDSRIGTFGAVGLILFLLLEIAAVAELPPGPRWRALLAAPALGRAAPVLLGWLLPPARVEGQGLAFGRALRGPSVGLAVAIAGLASLALLGLTGLVAAAAALGAALAVGRFVARRLGGITGDVLGAAVETGELAALLAVAAGIHAGR